MKRHMKNTKIKKEFDEGNESNKERNLMKIKIAHGKAKTKKNCKKKKENIKK